MSAYILRRLLLAVPTVMGATMIIFLIMRVVPGDVVDYLLGESATVSVEQKEALREDLGLNDPLPVQYLTWLKGVVTFQPGDSFRTRKPIMDEVRPRLLVTLELAGGTILLSLLIALPMGVISAVNQDKPLDYILRAITIGGISVPGFWIATLVILFLGKYVGWLPPIVYKQPWKDLPSNLQQMIIPAMILGFAYSAIVARMTRSAVLDVLREDYVRTARAKGLGSFVVTTRHVMRNAMLSVITITAAQIGALVGGTVIMETIFVLPGMGSYTVTAINQRDYPTIQFTITLLATSYVLINLLTDLSYAALDPRIRFGR